MGKLKKLREHFDNRLASLKRVRTTWVPLWESCCELSMPLYDVIDSDPKSSAEQGGVVNRNTIINAIGVKALRRMTNGLQSSLTNPSNRWFKLSTGSEKLDEIHAVKIWLYSVENMIYQACAKSNFYTATHGLCKDLGCIGTSAIIILPDKNTWITCKKLVAGSYYIATNHKGYVDTLYRRFAMTAGQLVGKFGLGKVSEEVLKCYDESNTQKYFNVVHVVEPNMYKNAGFVDNKNMEFVSAYYEESASVSGDGEPKFLNISGFREQPCFVPRWDVEGDSDYGKSPTMEAMPDLNMVQDLEADLLEGLDKQVRPPMTATHDVKQGGANSFSNGITYISDKDRGLFAPAYSVNFDLNSLNVKIEKVESSVQQFFYNDLFNLITDTSKRMTAYETSEKMGEKLMMLGSVADRLQYEYLDLVIDRIFGILQRAKKLDKAPAVLEGISLDIEYNGLLTQARRGKDANNIISLLSLTGNLSGVKPESLDNLDFDNSIRLIANRLGVDPKVLVDKDVMANMRKERANQQSSMQQNEQVSQNAANSKLLSETSLDGNNALTAIINATG